jgi:DNA-binding transcriptional ArsR family regulator
MVKENQEPLTHIIRDLETLKVLSDPLRWQIIEMLTVKPQTVKQLAEKLGLAPSKLYYHINLIENHGLIQVVGTRLVSGIIEKHYQTIAPEFEIDPELLNFGTRIGRESINAILLSTLDATRDDLLRSLQARAFALESGADPQPRSANVTRQISRIPDEKAAEFSKRLLSLMQEFEAADDEQAGQTYAMMVALYPTYYYRDDGEASPSDG